MNLDSFIHSHIAISSLSRIVYLVVAFVRLQPLRT